MAGRYSQPGFAWEQALAKGMPANGSALSGGNGRASGAVSAVAGRRSGRLLTLPRMSWTSHECARLAERLMGNDETRWGHVVAVAQRASELSGGDLVECAAWLHDVGYASELRRTGMHSLDGATYLRSINAPEQLVSLVAYHTGAEYEADERGLEQELASFKRPVQDQLDALTLADLSVGPTGELLSPSVRLDEILQRYPADHPVHMAVSNSRGYLEGCVARAQARLSQPM